MSGMVSLYVADEAVFPTSMTGSDKQKYEQLVATVIEKTSRWEDLELDTLSFMNALDALGELVGSASFFGVLSFNNSPHNCLGDDPDIEAPFGYFTPAMVKDALGALQALSDEIESMGNNSQIAIENHQPLNEDSLEYVYYRYLSAFEEAAGQNAAIVVLHEG